MLKLALEAYLMEEVREISGVSCIRELIPLIRAPPSRPGHLPKALVRTQSREEGSHRRKELSAFRELRGQGCFR